MPCSVLTGGLTHIDRGLHASRWAQPSEQDSFFPRRYPLPPLSLLGAERTRGWRRQACIPAAFLGQVEGSSWSLSGHTHPETSREWALSSPSRPRGQHTAAASGVLEKPLRVPPSGPRWFKGSWAVGGETLPSWPQASCDLGGGGGLSMSSGSREAPVGLGHSALSQ